MALFCTDYSLGLLGLRDGRWKLIHELESGRSQLYDLEADPDERKDVAGEHPERVEAYRDQLLNWCATQRYRFTRPEIPLGNRKGESRPHWLLDGEKLGVRDVPRTHTLIRTTTAPRLAIVGLHCGWAGSRRSSPSSFPGGAT